MTLNTKPFIILAFLAIQTLNQATYTGSINTLNAPNATSVDAQNLQINRDSWCNSTTVRDRNYNAAQQYYYRAMRGNGLGNWPVTFVDYVNGGSTTSAIQDTKWPFRLILALLCLSFVTWIFYLIFIFVFRKDRRNNWMLAGCLRFAILLLLCFFALYVVIIIWIGFAEVSQRHTKCQMLNVGNMLVNGYVSRMNGNQYVGLTALGQAVINFQNDVATVGNVLTQTNNIIGANYPSATSNAIIALQNVAANYSQATTYSGLGQVDQPFSIRNLNGWVSSAAQVEFTNLNKLGNTLDSAAKSVFGLIQNSGAAAGSQNIQTTVAVLNNFFLNMTADVVAASNSAYDTVRYRYGYATASYWAILAISMVIIALSIYLIGKLMRIHADPAESRNFTLLKALLAVLGLFLVFYGILTIFLLIGSSAISTFCTILGNVNQGNTGFLDGLRINWPGNSKQILKECTVGKTGNLWNFMALRPDAGNAVFARYIENIITGVLNYNNLYVNPQVNSSSSIAYLNSQYNAIKSGIAFDYLGIMDQFNFVYASWPYNTTGKIPSLTAFNCSSLTLSNQTNCLPIDTSLLTAFDPNPSNPSYSNYTIVRNLQSYIQSEQTLLTQLQANLQGRTDIITPGQAFHNIKVSLDANRNDVAGLTAQFASTLRPFSHYKGQAIYTHDCRNVRRELLVLEDHYCFELNYWIKNMLILVAASFCILYLLTWAIFAAILEADTEAEIVNFPLPVEENKADINEREMIPQA